ncbi:MAG TPA: hypothetical protein DDZ51_03585 [Planctomycetaceae bacterium]|nr:hypothetical protein [Planctomycetaceae bacterium]
MHYIHEDDIDQEEFDGFVKDGSKKKKIKIVGPAVSLPICEGRTIGQFDFSTKGWVSGTGRSAVWDDLDWNGKKVNPQFLMGRSVFDANLASDHANELRKHGGDKAAATFLKRISDPATFETWNLPNHFRLAFMDVSSATNTRTMISSLLGFTPSGNKTPLLTTAARFTPALAASLNSLSFDYQFRNRLVGTTLNYFIVAEAAIPLATQHALEIRELDLITRRLNCGSVLQAHWWIGKPFTANKPWRTLWAVSRHERTRLRCIVEALVACAYEMDVADMKVAIAETDYSLERLSSDRFSSTLFPKGLWRVDKTLPPEQRLTVLGFVAFAELHKCIEQLGNDRKAGIITFLTQNDGEGWQLPETLRLADYGLGHDERAKEHQPVRECFGPRFYDWQLAQTPEESWAECHLHARNLLGQPAYEKLLAGDASGDLSIPDAESAVHEDQEPFQLTGESPSRKRRR